MRPIPPKAKKLVFIGGGHTHALLLRMLIMQPVDDIQLTLINPSAKAPYTGMLPGLVAGHYERHDVEIDLIRLARSSNAQIILDQVVGLDHHNKTIQLNSRSPISYDVASVNVGIASDLPAIPGFGLFAIGAKPLGAFAQAWQLYLNHISSNHTPARIAVIGAGVAGVELALAMAHRLSKTNRSRAKLIILEKDSEILAGTSAKTKALLNQELSSADIEIKTASKIKEITQTEVHLEDGSLVTSDFTVGAAGATPHPWLSKTALDCENGFIKVQSTLQTVTDRFVFASGDCAHFTPNPLPKAGVFAVRQAPILLQNLKAALQDAPLKAYTPQKNYLKLISTGGKSAVFDKFGLALNGPLIWQIKDRIDRKFMDQFKHLPTMKQEGQNSNQTATPKDLREKYDQLCGGCGAKMESSRLAQVLSKQPAHQRSDILSAPGDDAAIIKHGQGCQVFTTDHLRAFTNDPWLMGKIAAIHAMGDIWAMGARPQAALASIILPPMADHLHAGMLEEILSAATQSLRSAGADLVGGHTSVGPELTVGFSITGLTEAHPVQNANAKPGDLLILTKPLGIGTILAAEMRGKADGYDVEAAYHQMSRPSQKASEILSPKAHGMTDVTGFGLAGHLTQMMINSGTQAILDKAQIPILDAAVTYANMGMKSSLWSANRAAIPNWTHDDTGEMALLFDPQTAGGLLASVPKEMAQELETALIDAGETASIIGEVTKGPPGLTLV